MADPEISVYKLCIRNGAFQRRIREEGLFSPIPHSLITPDSAMTLYIHVSARLAKLPSIGDCFLLVIPLIIIRSFKFAMFLFSLVLMVGTAD